MKNFLFPVAFWETGVAERIKHATAHKKPKKYSTILCILFCVMLTACFSTNRKINSDKSKDAPDKISGTPKITTPLTATPTEPAPAVLLQGTWTETADWDEYDAASANTGFYKEISMGNIKITLTTPKTTFSMRDAADFYASREKGIELGMQIEYTGPEESVLLIGNKDENEEEVSMFSANFQNPFYQGFYRKNFISGEPYLKIKKEKTPIFPVLYSDELGYGILSFLGSYEMSFLADFTVTNEQGTLLEGPYSYSLTLPFEIIDDKNYVWTKEELPDTVPDDFDLYATTYGVIKLDTENKFLANGYQERNIASFEPTDEEREELYRLLLDNDIFSLFREDFQPFYNSQVFGLPWIINTLSVSVGGKTAVITYRTTGMWISDHTPEQEKLGKFSEDLWQFIHTREEYAAIEDYEDLPD